MPRCTEVALVKLTPSELETITRLASLRGLATSDMIRELLRVQPEADTGGGTRDRDSHDEARWPH